MALTRTLSVFTYTSAAGGESFTFEVVVDAQGLCSVKNILGPSGDACSTGIPQIVLDDIQEAKDIVALLLSEVEVASGTIVFMGETELVEALPASLLNNADYRVVYTPPDDIQFRTEDKTIDDFKAVPSSAYGSGADPKSVDYSVLVAVVSTSTTNGTETFVAADASTRDVVFATPFTTTAYRVVLSPSDFFSARVTNKTKLGFTIEIGIGLMAAETVDVGFDVFV